METTNETNPKNLVKEFKADKTILKLKGTAPTQHNPEAVEITGTITAPARFLENRTGEFYDKKAHCMASTTDGTLKLVVNEQSVCDKYTIKGKVEVGKLFKKIGINDLGVSYIPMELARKFRMLKKIFPSVSEHREITTKLKNLVATVNKQVEESNDDRANVSSIFKQTVESNIPESFKLHLPLLEGEEPETIDVAVILEVQGSDIVCFLESVDGQEKIDTQMENLVKEEVAKIEEKVLVIFH